MNFKRSTTSMAIAIMALSLISMTSVQQDVFATTQGMSITATADQGSNTIVVTGMTAIASNDVTFVVPEFGTIAAMILAVAIISIIAISAKSRLSIIPRY